VGDGGVISTQPTQRPSEEPPAIPTMASSAVRPESSVSISGTTNTDTERAGTGGYQPVTNYEQQERVNPFDKEPNKSGSAASIHTTTSSSSSMSSSSISSRINRNGNAIKSPPPPAGPPPPPPTNVVAAVGVGGSNANSSSGYRNSFSSSLSKDKTSYGNYGSTTSVVVVAKDGREYIISACDSTFALIGDSQEEDRRQIADLVSGRMQVRGSIQYMIFNL